MPWPGLLANENIPAPTVRVLRAAGVDVTSVTESMASSTDRRVLAHARSHGLWLLTMDRDYGELVFAREARPPPAIVYLRQGPETPTELGATVLALLSDADFVRGHLVVVRGRTVRRRPLPDDA